LICPKNNQKNSRKKKRKFNILKKIWKNRLLEECVKNISIGLPNAKNICITCSIKKERD